jgi:phosphatidylinositol glycan class V
VFLLSFGVALRSNGLFLAPAIGLQILYKFIVSIKKLQFSSTLSYLLKGTIILLLMVAPFVFHLVFSYNNLCIQNINFPSICDSSFPNMYSYIQEKYWNVGLFNYFTSSNALFIAIGAPAIILSLCGLMACYNS